MQTTNKTFIFSDNQSRQKLLGGKVGFKDGVFILDGFTTPPADQRGSYWTALPISKAAYREKHKTKTAYEVGDGFIVVYCDWGHPHRIDGPDDLIKGLADECVAEKIPALDEAGSVLK